MSSASDGATKRSASIRDRLIRSSTMRSMRRASLRMVPPKRAMVCGVELVGVGERLGIADHGRQRRAQLVAGIGDEIDPHPLGRHGLRSVDQPEQHQPLAERADEGPERSRPDRRCRRRRCRRRGRQARGRARADGGSRGARHGPRCAARASRARGAVGDPHDVAVDHHRRLVERVDDPAGKLAAHRPCRPALDDCRRTRQSGRKRSPLACWRGGCLSIRRGRRSAKGETHCSALIRSRSGRGSRRNRRHIFRLLTSIVPVDDVLDLVRERPALDRRRGCTGSRSAYNPPGSTPGWRGCRSACRRGSSATAGWTWTSLPAVKLLLTAFFSLPDWRSRWSTPKVALERAPAALAERLEHLGPVPRAVLVAAGFAGEEIAGLDIAAPEGGIAARA